MADILVWVMVAWTYGSAPPVMFGPFSDLESCQRVQNSAPFKRLLNASETTQCVQVKQPRSKNG